MTAQALFITGTDTGVGKTIVTAGLAQAILATGARVCVYKPVQTGAVNLEEPDDPMDIQRWLGNPEGLTVTAGYVFEPPVAPWVADPTGTIQMARLVSLFEGLSREHDWVLVEGAGGVRVPLTSEHDTLDLIEALNLPTIVVTRPNLGTLNHTRLTVDALLARKLPCLGVVVSNMPPSSNEMAIQTLPDVFHQYLPVPVLGWVPPVEPGHWIEDPASAVFSTLLDTISRCYLPAN